MRFTAVRYVVLLASLLFADTFLANAQDLAGLEDGIKAYGAYQGGDIDTIGMSNGALSLAIPLISFPQRGGRLRLGVSLIYNNPVYTLKTTALTKSAQ